MHAATGHLAGRKETRNGRRTVQISPDPAHHIMRAGRHRDPFLRDIDVVAKAGRINRRESPLDELRPQVGDIKIDMPRFRRRHLRQDRPRHDISRRQRSHRVISAA